MMPFDAMVRRACLGSDRARALAADRQRVTAEDRAEEEYHRAVIDPFTRECDGVLMGSTWLPRGHMARVFLPSRIARGLSAWLVGRTGSGKTTFLTHLALQDLQARNVQTITLDFGGALASNLLDHVIPALLVAGLAERGASLVRNLRVVSPWKGLRLPSLNVTARLPGSSIDRRLAALLDVFIAAVGAGDLGIRQRSAITPAVRLLFQLAMPFTLLLPVLTMRAFRMALLMAAGDPALSAYFDERFELDCREGVVASIAARLDRFLADEATRLAMYAPAPFDPSAWLEHGTTIADLGHGLREHRVFWAAFLQRSIIEAMLTRRVTRNSPQVIARVDELPQALVSSQQGQDLDDALAIVRNRKCAMQVAHQHTGQLLAFPSLVQSLRTNCGFVAAFAVPEETAAATACVIPEMLPHGIDARGVSEAEQRAIWMRVLSALPQRTFLLRAPGLSPSSIPVRAMNLDVESLSAGIPADIRALVRAGPTTYARRDLALREHEWQRAAHELNRTQEPNTDALLRLAAAPENRGIEMPARRRRRRTPETPR